MAETRGANRPANQNPSSSTQIQPRQSTGTERSNPSLARWEASPFSFMRRFMSDLDSLFGDFGFGTPLTRDFYSTGDSALWSPQIDVSSRDGQLLVHADLPGLKQDDVKVTVQDGVLTLSGERNDTHEENRDGVYRRERSYGSFRRQIALPEGVDPESIQASFDNGVLEVTMPLPKEAKPQGRSIPIGQKTTGGGAGRDVH